MKFRLIALTPVVACIIAASAWGAAEDAAPWRPRESTLADAADRDIYRSEDVDEEVVFGREVAARVMGRYGLYRNPEVQRYVNLVGRSVAQHTGRADLEFRFGVLNTDEVNAYAAPGGYVLITRGALARMQDESELAGVLAHEIGHIAERHVVRELNIRASESSAVTGVARLIGGGTESARTAFSQAVDRALDMLFKDGYKREDEVQADKDAVLFAAYAGYDPEGLIRYFKRLESSKKRNTEVLDRTHPAFKDRIALLSSVIATEGISDTKALVGAERFSRIGALLSVEVPVPLTTAPVSEEPLNWRQRASADEMITTEDVSEEIAFGREVAARVMGRYGLYRNPEVQRYVNLVGRSVAQHTGRADLEFRFGVLNTDEVNAYAAPGGYVLITRGALARMQDESELAGVLAHEIGHIAERHVVRELNIRASESSAVTGVARLIGGGTESARTAFSQAVDRALDMLFKDGYKREDEVQADKDAVLFAAYAGYDPEGLIRYFRKLSDEKGNQRNTEILDRTHPPYDERIATLTWQVQNEGISAGKFNKDRERFGAEMKSLAKQSK